MLKLLHNLGWDEYFKRFSSRYPEFVPARVTRKHSFGYNIITESGNFSARLRGSLRKSLLKEQWPVVGDWVMVSFNNEKAIVEVILPRRNKISRKTSGKTSVEQVITANADIIFLVVSLLEDFNPRKIERYLTLSAENHIDSIILLNKIDCIEDSEHFLRETRKLAPNIPILLTNAHDPLVVDTLLKYLSAGKTAVFLGPSGVGKSTIVNALLGRNVQLTGSIGKNNKGKHTTSSRDMFFLENGGIIIDNPGIRELYVWLDNCESLSESFSDIQQLGLQCQFRNCAHLHEPNCAVRNAIQNGQLDSGRLENWRKLKSETLELLSKRQEAGQKIHKKQSHILSEYKKKKKIPGAIVDKKRKI